MKIIDKLIMPMNEALLAASINAGEGKKFKDLDPKIQRRIKLWNLGEWWHWWRWRAFLRQKHHEFIMWQHKHNLRCRCVSYHQRTGKHTSNCPKYKRKFWRPK